MKRIMTVVFATLFAASTGAFAAASAQGDTSKSDKAKTAKTAKKGGAMKSDAKNKKEDSKKK